jgi:transposase-like protein
VPGRKRRSFTRDFKLSALKRMAETDNIHALAQELGIERKLLYCWRDAFVAPAARPRAIPSGNLNPFTPR